LICVPTDIQGDSEVGEAAGEMGVLGVVGAVLVVWGNTVNEGMGMLGMVGGAVVVWGNATNVARCGRRIVLVKELGECVCPKWRGRRIGIVGEGTG